MQGLQGLRCKLVWRLSLEVRYHLTKSLTHRIVITARVDIVLNHINLFLLVVKNQIRLIDEEMHIRCPNRVFRNLTDIFIETNHVIACKPDSTTCEREIRLDALDCYLVQVFERILINHLTIFIKNTILEGYFKDRIVGNNRKTCIFLLTRNRFKDNLVFPLNTHISQDWC